MAGAISVMGRILPPGTENAWIRQKQAVHLYMFRHFTTALTQGSTDGLQTDFEACVVMVCAVLSEEPFQK